MMNTMTPIIITEDLSKTFKASDRIVQAVDRVSLSIGRGELFGLFGTNGAGKSTLVRMLATILAPSSGQARIGGLDVVKNELAVRALVGLVTAEERSFYGRLSARKNLRFFAALTKRAPAGNPPACRICSATLRSSATCFRPVSIPFDRSKTEAKHVPRIDP